MQAEELVPMTRRRYRSLLRAAEDAARTATTGNPADRARPAAAVPAPRSRRRASLRRPQPTT